MSESTLQDIGKIAGLAGIALGVFLLLFREVIRKNIFPKLPVDRAYLLIRQFMYLTFGIAFVGIAAWTYMMTQPSDPTPKPIKLLKSVGDISGVWTAEVKYSWGTTHKETFQFKAVENKLTGTAGYVTAPRAIKDGIVSGNQVTFKTTSFSNVGEKQYQETHMYKGTLSGDVINFELTTDSEYADVPALRFTAYKSVPGDSK